MDGDRSRWTSLSLSSDTYPNLSWVPTHNTCHTTTMAIKGRRRRKKKPASPPRSWFCILGCEDQGEVDEVEIEVVTEYVVKRAAPTAIGKRYEAEASLLSPTTPSTPGDHYFDDDLDDEVDEPRGPRGPSPRKCDHWPGRRPPKKRTWTWVTEKRNNVLFWFHDTVHRLSTGHSNDAGV